MPFDNTNFPPSNPHPIYSLLGLRDWLREKGEGEYDYMNCEGNCLIGQYLIARTGKIWESVDSQDNGWLLFTKKHKNFSDVSFGCPRTFPAALARVEKLLSEKAHA